MKKITRKKFLQKASLASTALIFPSCNTLVSSPKNDDMTLNINLEQVQANDDIFTFLHRTYGKFDLTKYRQIIGTANPYKEGDETIGVAAKDEATRKLARQLLSNTSIGELDEHLLFEDELAQLIQQTTDPAQKEKIKNWTLGELKNFLLTQPESEIKIIMPSLSSDVIAGVVKLMTNDELIQVGQKIFNPLAGSKIGAKGYLGARIQPNSPTDNLDDIRMQVFCGWSYAVGDLVLGTNPVSSTPASVARIESTLFVICGVSDSLSFNY